MNVKDSSSESMNSALREHEYTCLRKEIEENKKMVFERAMLIAGVALAATMLPKDAKGIELIGIPSIGALFFNLWFTVNRLKSSARIIAYIQIFYESECKYKWIGWENALRKYRIWFNECDKEVNFVKSKLKNINQYDNLSFYMPILILHVAMAFSISFLMSFRALLIGPYHTVNFNLPVSFFLILNGSVFVFFIVLVLIFYRPSNLKFEIEKNRLLWMAVMSSCSDGCLSKINDKNELNDFEFQE